MDNHPLELPLSPLIIIPSVILQSELLVISRFSRNRNLIIQVSFRPSTYSSNHPEMKLGSNCGDNFENGITQGYEWYPLYGGMQDFNYVNRETFEITLELSCTKNPPANTLEGHWKNNKVSLMEYMKATLHGVSGVVRDGEGQPVSGAIVMVDDIDYKVFFFIPSSFLETMSTITSQK